MSGRSLFSRSSARRRVRTHDGPSAIAPSPASPPCEVWGVSRALSISLDGPVPFLVVKRSRTYDAMIVVHVLGRAVRVYRDDPGLPSYTGVVVPAGSNW